MDRIISISLAQFRKLLLSGLCVLLLMGGIFLAPNRALTGSALAVSLPPGEYDFLNRKQPAPLTAGETGPYSPYTDLYQGSYPRQVFWGDTHLHTSYSFDAGAGGTTLTPEASYRFARGEQVTTDTGEPVQLSRPLDFLVVSDHTDQLGSFQQFVEDPPDDCGDDQSQVDEWHYEITEGTDEERAQAQKEIISAFAQDEVPVCMLQTQDQFRTAWTDEVNWAEEFNDPHTFTAIIGYEWTALDAGDNLHRNVLFRDNGDKAQQLLPKTTEDGPDPELLWQWMESYETQTGGQVLAIPHNGNLSNGQMFADLDAGGETWSTSYAAQRQRWEPLYEVIQVKGASETNEILSPDDEFARFETDGWMDGNLDLSVPKTSDMFEYEYARAALKNGLELEADLGVNPFKFGLVGSTDYHIALSAAEEENNMGKLPFETPGPNRATEFVQGSLFPNEDYPDAKYVERVGWQYAAAGYVGVWAEENTRTSLFDAMQRREVYATSGPRMVVRLFGGWDFTADDLTLDPGEIGYAKGVPMGGDLPPAPPSDLSSNPTIPSPTFLVAAMKDPLRANLDRIQIVKGWLDDLGNTHEQVYDVAWSDDRVPDPDTGKLPPVGSIINPEITDPATDPGTVDTDTATWTNTIGASELAQVWTDPEFEPEQRAFYYARVLEIPTPRWTDYDKAFYGDAWCGEKIAETGDPSACDHIPLILQERVYTSPIWYSPATAVPLPASRSKFRRRRR